MTDYLAILKARISKTPIPHPPSKPSKAPFEGFEGDHGRGVLKNGAAKKQRADLHQDPFEGFEGYPRRRVLKNEGLRSRLGVPQEWVDGLGSLSREDPLPGFSEASWDMLLDDGLAFINRWGAKAAELGWTTGDVFGVHPTAPPARFDQMGLVPVIAGGRVSYLSQDTATITSPGGSRLTYYRNLRSEGAYLWHRQNPQKGVAA